LKERKNNYIIATYLIVLGISIISPSTYVESTRAMLDLLLLLMTCHLLILTQYFQCAPYPFWLKHAQACFPFPPSLASGTIGGTSLAFRDSLCEVSLSRGSKMANKRPATDQPVELSDMEDEQGCALSEDDIKKIIETTTFQKSLGESIKSALDEQLKQSLNNLLPNCMAPFFAEQTGRITKHIDSRIEEQSKDFGAQLELFDGRLAALESNKPDFPMGG